MALKGNQKEPHHFEGLPFFWGLVQAEVCIQPCPSHKPCASHKPCEAVITHPAAHSARSGQCMYHYKDGNLNRVPASMPQPTQASDLRFAMRDADVLLSCSVAPIIVPLFFLGGFPTKNGLPQNGFPCFSRVTEQRSLDVFFRQTKWECIFCGEPLLRLVQRETKGKTEAVLGGHLKQGHTQV